MRIRFGLPLFALGLALLAPLAKADTTISLLPTGSTNTISFTLPDTPTIVASDATSFEVGATVNWQGYIFNDLITFFTSAAGGGLGDAGGTRVYGDQLFSGSTSNPTFLTQISNLTDGSGNVLASADVASTAVPAPTTGVTPEPSSLALMGTGLLGVAGALRRRFLAA